ncbi:leucine--tRNA ligase [Flavobacterium sp.]|jgi:leucyl-tRNA synthetase|uniref:leucine--tRNA ligase n=1 Tax=Flavobacterium sp. TaxID=239 RepID=UPI0037C148C9
MKYHHEKIEAKWQKYWAENQTFKAINPTSSPLEGLGEEKPKYYVLDMFPYPSGAGLHVGHPLGYIASDIVARFKRHKGFNVLHPQGYDSFGLPAEQYAIQTGQHPEKTTRENIARYREQLDKIGFSFDWSREVRTSNPNYYKHTQWIFIQLFNSWYNKDTDKAEDISNLISIFEKAGNAPEVSGVNAVCDDNITSFSAEEWNSFSEEKKQQILLQYRLTYLAETEVNWCPALGTVLANDEIVNGVSERGGHPVIRKKMTQWSMRISAYAERLLQGLETIDWSESIKESQRNWIGKSVGGLVKFKVFPHPQPLSKGEGSQASKPGYKTANPLYAKELVGLARNNRKEQTEAEEILWKELRNSNLGFKIRRQHYIGNFIVDFVSLDKKLVIEIDGGYHNDIEQKERDEERTLILEQKHYFKVIRFTNQEVEKDLNTVLSKIKSELQKRASIDTKATLSIGEGLGVRSIEVFTTRPDTIFGVTFMTLAPEHELVSQITTPAQKAAVDAYIEATAKRSERERMADIKTISGVFTGAFAEHPFTAAPIPIWIGDYVLAGYGTGAVMAVPCGDERDYAFAKHFNIPIKNIFNQDISETAFVSKEGFQLVNSDFLNGLGYKEATKKVIEELEKIGQGKGKTNYRLRDAVFSRQRYWGEPFPVYYVNGLPQMIDAKHLPIVLPEVEKYLPTEDGQPPLGNATDWAWDSVQCSVVSNQLIDDKTIFPLELNTMPGWAGSSWYWMRYMDAHNDAEFASQEALNYWENVDLYIGGSEHATGHLLYSRFWNKFLKDIGYAPTEEPFKKLINQGMILGMSAFVYRVQDYSWKSIKDNQNGRITLFNKLSVISSSILKDQEKLKEVFVLQSKNIDSPEEAKEIAANINQYEIQINTIPIHVDLSVINDIANELDVDAFLSHPLYSEYKDAEFIRDNGKYIVGREVEKMSKSKYNVVNPDDICNDYGADTLRLYEMFLGPLEQAKPWNTAGITGVSGFLKKLWKLYHSGENETFYVDDSPPSEGLGEAFKSLHKTIKKVTEDIENFSFNTSVSQFMICVNELAMLKCNHRKILEPLAILISPYAPHIAEELWAQLGHSGSISTVPFPVYEEKYLVEREKEYPVSFNGKMRFTIKLSLDLTVPQIQEIVMADERTIKHLEGKTPNKVIIVPGKVINFVG